jgi:mono/diheme cytochrome c family protein
VGTTCSPARSAIVLLAVAALTGTVACAAALRQPTELDVRSATPHWPGTTLKDLQRGRSLYVRRCSGCHTLYLPSAYDAEVWPSLVESMSGKAALSREQQKDITRFVVTLAPAPSH